jgi:protein-S-isoprenylcysteine O-methyltransferase Ste14
VPSSCLLVGPTPGAIVAPGESIGANSVVPDSHLRLGSLAGSTISWQDAGCQRSPRGSFVKALSTRHWSDWVGTAAFTAIAVSLFRQAPEFGLLMLPGLLQEILVAISFLLRGRARLGAPGWTARAVAYAHSFLVMGFILVAAEGHREWIRATEHQELRTLGSVLWLSGAVLSLWPLWHLRRSFSIEPEARTLVTSGPYRLARHPIYTIYLLINLGILLRHLTAPFAAVLVVWIGLLLVRIRYEEMVLGGAFPEYREYRRRVAAFGPRLRTVPLDREAHS